MNLEKEYLDARKFYYRNWERIFPIFHKAMFDRRYILPNYRLPDYHNQDACDYLMLDGLFGYLEGELPLDDHVLGHCISNFVRTLHYNRPTFYLERELGFPLLKTPLPLDYYVQDINWRWPAFRVYLPRNLLTISRDNQVSHVMFLEIVRMDKDSEETIPTPIEKELEKNLSQSKFPGKIPLRISSFEGMCVTCWLDFEGGATAYAASCQLTEATIRQIMTDLNTGEGLESPWKLDEIDKEFENRMLALAINILLFLSALPLEYEQQHSQPIRNPKLEGRHLISGLYPARFIGQSQLRPKTVTPGIHQPIPTPTGKHQDPQWRAGHWKRVWYGPKKGLHRLQWIALYHTGSEKEEQPQKAAE